MACRTGLRRKSSLSWIDLEGTGETESNLEGLIVSFDFLCSMVRDLFWTLRTPKKCTVEATKVGEVHANAASCEGKQCTLIQILAGSQIHTVVDPQGALDVVCGCPSQQWDPGGSD